MLWRSVTDETPLVAFPTIERFGAETTPKQVFHRLAGCWAYWGGKHGYFDAEEDAQAYYDEMRLMLAARWPRPIRRNGSTRASIGLWHRWSGQGHYYVDSGPAS